MDNNFNQQQAQGQPVYQQQMPTQQAPVQQVYQQQMPAQQPVFPQAPKKPSNTNTKELLALILSASGAFLAVLGSILTCSCSASKSWDVENFAQTALGSLTSALSGGSVSYDIHSTSAVLLVALLGAIVAAVGAVFGILAIKDKNATVKAGKMAYIAVAVGVFGVMYGILPVLTICGYNCSLNSSMSDAVGGSLSNLF